MLSAESASGKFPIDSVKIMDRIIRGVENDISYRQILESKKIKLNKQPLMQSVLQRHKLLIQFLRKLFSHTQDLVQQQEGC